MYVEWDLLTRTLRYLGYEVKRVMNTTDVGQMTSDADLGEDKMAKAVRREKEKGNEMSPQQIADLYTELFLKDADSLNLERPTVLSPASHHISEMIDLITKLEDKGFAYRTKAAVYFDVSQFPEYTKLSRQKLDENQVGVRDEVVVDPDKRHPADFRLWQLDQQAVLEWDSPWGKGFPGWHIECSAMAMKYLGESIDIHTGGVDHIPVHHTNEIAQSEAATGKPFAHYWLHGEFLKVDGRKMSKSAGTFYILHDILERGFEPLDFRYFCLQAHYRTPQNFTWAAMESARSARKLLIEQIEKLSAQTDVAVEEDVELLSVLKREFQEALNNDINVPGALAVLWKVVRHPDLSAGNKVSLAVDFDSVLGLGLTAVQNQLVDQVQKFELLLQEREVAKRNKNYVRADEIRDQLTREGYRIIDTPEGPQLVSV